MRGLGDLLVRRGLVSDQDLEHADAVRREAGGNVVSALLRMGAVSEDDLLALLSEQVGLAILDPAAAPSLETVRETLSSAAIPVAWCVENEVILWRSPANGPLQAAGPRLHEPDIQEAMDQWPQRIAHAYLAKALVVEPILIALSGDQTRYTANTRDPSRLLELAEEAPVVDFVNSVFAEAIALNASDIHFEPFEDKIVVRLRVDGVLTQRRSATREMFDAVSSRLKLLSGMDIAERRLPQDGRQSIRVAGRMVDVRVSSLPTTWGESVVVRLLGDTRRIPELAELGLDNTQRALLMSTIAQPHGLALVTGPTGSGKTTTVYRLLQHLNDGVRKIVTIEDPVELQLPGVLQMNVRPDIDLDFATGLRSTLRQDPDVIFVGEIRDSETARTAVQAALTGHLVISTLHTNSAFAAVARMIDLGVEKFLLADVLRAVMGQRLVRRVCEACAAPESDPDCDGRANAILAPADASPARWRHGLGCKACAGTGFKGRVGVFEAARVDSAMAGAIRAGASEADLIALARGHGFATMLESGVAKARAGETTFVEALRVFGGPAP